MKPGQASVLLIALLILFILLAAFPHLFCVTLAWVLIVAFDANAAFRAFLLLAGDRPSETEDAGPVATERLPAYSILVPLYREANVMPALARALRALDYPGIR